MTPTPIIVTRWCHAIDFAIMFLYLILMPVFLGDNPSLQEILTNFCSFKDNPHFYEKLPTLLKAHRNSVKIDPTEDFRHASKFYVLTDKQELVHIVTGNKILHSFGNLWRSENTIIFEGSGGIFWGFPPFSDVLTDICGRLMGGSIVKASLNGTFGEFYAMRLPVSIGGVPRAFRTRNDRGLHPINTEMYPWIGWERFIDSPPLTSNGQFC